MTDYCYCDAYGKCWFCVENSTSKFSKVAAKVLLEGIRWLEEVSECPFCNLACNEDDFAPHEEGCPFVGYELSEDMEPLKAFAKKVADG